MTTGTTIISRNYRRKVRAEADAKTWREKLIERQKAEEALRWSEEKYRILVETMNEGLAVSDENGLFTYVNDRLCRMLGYSREEIIGRPVRGLLDEGNRKILDEQMVRRRGGEHESYEICWNGKDRKKIIALVSPQPIIDQKGEFKGSFAVIMDITDRKKSEEALQESEKQLRALSSQLMAAQENERKRISHELHDELGQDLNVMRMRVGFIKKKLKDGQTDLREDSEAATQYIDQAIENIRRISRDLSPSILEDLGLVAALRWLAENFSKTYHIPVSMDLEEMHASFPDVAQILIYRVIQEALNNVAKHAGATEVSISVNKSEGILSFGVKDNGKGLDLKQVFSISSGKMGMGMT